QAARHAQSDALARGPRVTAATGSHGSGVSRNRSASSGRLVSAPTARWASTGPPRDLRLEALGDGFGGEPEVGEELGARAVRVPTAGDGEVHQGDVVAAVA